MLPRLELDDVEAGGLGPAAELLVVVRPGSSCKIVFPADLPEAVQERVERGGLSPATAYEVSKLEDPVAQVLMAEVIAEQKLIGAEVVAAVQAVKARRPTPAAKPAPVDLDLGDGIAVRIIYRKPSTVNPTQALRKALKLLSERERQGEADAA